MYGGIAERNRANFHNVCKSEESGRKCKEIDRNQKGRRPAAAGAYRGRAPEIKGNGKNYIEIQGGGGRRRQG